MSNSEEKYISLQEATKYCHYSQEYLSLRARQGKLKAVKFGRNWVTKKEWLEEYLRKVEEYNNQVKVKKFEEAVSAKELAKVIKAQPLSNLRFGFVLVLGLVLLTAGIVFGKDSLKSVYQDLIDTHFQIVNSTISTAVENVLSVPEKVVMAVSKLGGEMVEGLTELGSGILEIAKKAELTAIAAKEISQEMIGTFKEFGQWVGESIKNQIAKIRDSFVKGYEFITRPWRTPFLEEVKVVEVKKEEIEKLQAEIKELKERPAKEIVREIEVSRVTKVEPIKEITKEKIITKIDDKELAKIKKELSSFALWGRDIENFRAITQKLQAHPVQTPVPTAPLYIGSQGIQVGGIGSFASLGVSGFAGIGNLGVGGSTSLGSTPSDKLTVQATSEFNAPVFAKEGLTVGRGTLTIDEKGNLTTTGKITVKSDLVIEKNLIVHGVQIYGGTGQTAVATPQDIHTGATPTFGRLTLSAGTLTSDLRILDLSATWNAPTVAFTGIRLNVTDIASAPGSALLDLQTGGVSRLFVRKDGNVGIGTTAPGTLLTLRGSTTGNVFAIRNIGDTADTFAITDTGIVNLGTWQGTPIGAIYGGTGQTAVATGDILFGSAPNTWSRLAVGAAGTVLVGGTTPSWSATPSLTSLTLTGTTPLTLTGTSPVTIARNTTTADILTIDNLGTGTFSLNLIDGGLKTAGIERLTNAGALTNITGITSSGTITFSGLTIAGPVITSATGVLSSEAQLAISRGGTGLSTLGTANQLLGVNAGATGLEYKTIAGTTNQITVTHGAGLITLATPQDIHTGATPTFGRLTLSAGTLTSDLRILDLSATWNAPTVAFTGIRLNVTDIASAPGSALLDLQTGGVSRLFVRKDGNVGIGTTAPGTLLTLRGSTTGNVFAIRNIGDTADTFAITDTGIVNLGTWQGTPIGAIYGGTGQTAVATGDILFGSAPNTWSRLAVGAAGTVLVGGTTPSWSATPSLTSLTLTGTTPLTLTGTSPVTIARNTTTADILTIDNLGTGTFSLNLIDGGLKTAGIERLTNAGALTNITGITSSGTITFSGLTIAGPVITSATGVLSSEAQLAISRGGTGLSTLGTANQLLGVNAGATGLEYKTIAGTTNQITVTHGAGLITLATPQDIHTGATPTFGRLTLSAGTLTSDLRILDLSATWNAPTVAFTGIRLNVTDIASAPGSALLDLQTGGVSRLFVRKDGNVGIGTTAPGTLLTLRGSTTGNVFAIRNIGDTADTFAITDTGIVNLGTWQGTPIGAIYGGTGQTAVATGDILFGSAPNTWSRLAVGAAGTVLVGGTTPSWSATPSLTSLTLTGTTPLTLTGTSPVTIARNTTTADILTIDNLGTGTFSLNLIDGGLKTAGIERLTNAGALTNITGITSSGTITFSGLTADRLVTTTTGGTLTTSISSANLAASVTDETGSGLLVFNTSPSFTTSVVTGSPSFDVFNTTATTINAFGAATALTIGATTGTTTIRTPTLSLSADSAILNFSSTIGTKQIRTGGTTHLALMPGGNVGIGTTDATSRFTIMSPSEGSAGVPHRVFAIRNPAPIGQPDQFAVEFELGATHILNPRGGTLSLNRAGGNVGIGTTAPGSLLDIRAPSVPELRISSDATVRARFGIATTAGWINRDSLLNSLVIGNDAGALHLGTGNIVRMTVDTAGNVGIGTTAPEARLDVVGAIRATGNIGNWGRFTVGGVSGMFYPVQFRNDAPGISVSSDLMIYRSNVHMDGLWFGTFTLKISFRPINWGHFGHGSQIEKIEYLIGQGSPYNNPVGDIVDGSISSSGDDIIIWLRGGATYEWKTMDTAGAWTLLNGNPGGTSITDSSGVVRSPITSQSALIVNAKNRFYTNALSLGTAGTLRVDGTGSSHILGNVGIGTTAPGTLLTLRGSTTGNVFAIRNIGDTADTFAITDTGIVNLGTWQGTPIGAIYGGTGQTAVATGDILFGSAPNTWSRLAVGAAGTVLVGGTTPSWSATPSLTSLTLTGTTPLTLTGTSPVTIARNTTTADILTIDNLGTGTFSLNLIDGGLKTAGIERLTNAGALTNITGITSSGTITFSGLTIAGPVITSATGVLSSEAQLAISRGGTGLSTLGTANQLLGVNAGATGLEYKTIAGTTNQITVTHGAGLITLATPQDIHTGATPTFGRLTLSAGTLTSDLRILDLSATWNAPTVAFTGIRLNVTDIASAPGSALLDLQTGGVSRLFVRKDGNVGIGTTAPGTLLTLRGSTTGNVFAIRNIGDTADTFAITDTGIVNLGTWQGTPIGAIYGGTGQTAVATGDILFGSAPNTWSRLAVGAAGTVLVGGTTPSWSATPSLTSLTLTGTTPLTLTGTSPVTIARNTTTADILTIDNLGTGTFSLNLIDGGLKTAGIERLTNAGALTNITGITSSGTITFSGLTADRLVTTTTGGTLTTSISSANLAASVTDETGSGLLVFNTSPSFTTSVVTGSPSFDVFNTTATTINAFGAATALTIGATTGTTTIRTPTLSLSADSAILNFSSTIGTKQIRTGGTTHLALMPGGNVGIGTTDATSRFTIMSPSEGSAGVPHRVFAIRNPAPIGQPDQFAVEFELGATHILNPRGGTLSLNRAGGNVGIGTTAPGSLLDIRAPSVPELRISSDATVRARFGIATTAGWINRDSLLNSLVIGNDAGALHLGTGNIVRMTVDTAGNVGIGTTAPATRLHIVGASGDEASGNVIIGTLADANLRMGWLAGSHSWIQSHAGLPLYINRLGNNVILNALGGNVGIGTTAPTFQLQLSLDSAAKPGTNTWTVVSDIRVKKDIRPYTDGLEIIRQINPIWYKYNGLAGFTADGKDHIGVIAQDIVKVAPYTVGINKTKLNADDLEKTELLSFNSHALTFAFINAFKEIDKEIKELKLQLNQNGDLLQNGQEVNSQFVNSQSNNSLIETIKQVLASLGLFIENGIAKIKELFAEKVTTKQICLEGDDGETICIDKNQLKELLQRSGDIGE